jgi:hypothetical protein
MPMTAVVMQDLRNARKPHPQSRSVPMKINERVIACAGRAAGVTPAPSVKRKVARGALLALRGGFFLLPSR